MQAGRLRSSPLATSENDRSGREQVAMNLAIELEQEEDGRWIAEIDELDGVVVYGGTRDEAITNVKTLARDVIADRCENG